MSAKNSDIPSEVLRNSDKKSEDKHNDSDNGSDRQDGNESDKKVDKKKTDKKVEEDENVKKAAEKKKPKLKSKTQTEHDVSIEELQRDVLVRDDTIKEQNMLIVELETKLKTALEKAEVSKKATKDYKISNMENDLRHAKMELVLNSERIQKFMEDGSKTIEEYRTRYEQANQEILNLRNEILAKESLLKNKDDVYKRVLDDLQDARKEIGILQLEKIQLDTKNNQIQGDLDRVKEEKLEFENRVIDLESIQSKIKKQNELIDELDTKFFGLSIEELSHEINQSMFDLV